MKKTIAIAGVGYVGLSLAVLLSQHNKVYSVDTDPVKVDLLKDKKVTDTGYRDCRIS